MRERYAFPDDPHDICLRHLMEQVNTYAERTDQVSLIIADELQEHDRRRRDLQAYRTYGTPGYRSSTLPRIVDTIHFASSRHSRLLQATDLVVFLHHRREVHTETDRRALAANATLWARIQPKVQHVHTWHP
ncbi:MAG: DUF3800 domain-containing protein [Dermatophilaceae bacterium]